MVALCGGPQPNHGKLISQKPGRVVAQCDQPFYHELSRTQPKLEGKSVYGVVVCADCVLCVVVCDVVLVLVVVVVVLVIAVVIAVCDSCCGGGGGVGVCCCFVSCFETVASWQHCTDYNTTSARLSVL